MTAVIWILIFLCLLVALAYTHSSLKTATAATGILLLAWTLTTGPGWPGLLLPWLIYGLVAGMLHNTTLRKRCLTGPALAWFRRALPRLTEAERVALEAGTVGWEAELFSGMPDWQQLERLPPPRLTAEEQAFIGGPLQALLETVDNAGHDSPNMAAPDDGTWQHLREHGFFGLAIPQRFGGLGFSAHARSCILTKIASAPGGATLGPIVAVPNALGPAQLLLASGTDDQKAFYLPRLAAGDDIPCFAITSARAGTNAAALTDHGVVCEQEYGGRHMIGIRLNWDKRHITLAPAATLIGLAVRLYDPDRLLGHTPELGITCVLVDANAPGVTAGRRHQPVGAAFPYGPTRGTDVFVPLDAVIGGPEMIGAGWQLIMDCLPIGRALSLPSAAAGIGARNTRLAGAYCRLRHQFGRAIGAFDGVEEVLARVGGNSYACEAMRRLTANTVDLGERPAIAAGIAKYHGTTRAQQIVIDSMTLHAGKAACGGPANPVADSYSSIPLDATADGTNIFTRSVLIFGQGGIRCHPCLQAEIDAANRPDPERALAAFDAVFPGHVGHTLTAAARALVLGITNGRGSPAGRTREMTRHYQRINRYAAALALIADLAMASLGDNLRHRENLSARLGDILSQLYIASAALQRYREDGGHRQDIPLVAWVCEHCFADIETQLAGVLQHLPSRPLAWCTGLFIFPRGRHAAGPSDTVNHRAATVLQTPGETRDRLTPMCYRQAGAERGVALFDDALRAAVDTAPLRKRLRRAMNRGELDNDAADRIARACETGLLEQSEADRLRQARRLHDEVIRVDDYPPANGRHTPGKAP